MVSFKNEKYVFKKLVIFAVENSANKNFNLEHFNIININSD